MKSVPPEVSIVIPNWNGVKHLDACLTSVLAQTYFPIDITVVDNGSSDDSIRLIRSRFPTVKLIENQTNLGFSAAVNLGIKESSSPYVVLLNNDTRVENDWVEQLVSGMESTPQAALGASKILLYEAPVIIDSAGDGFSIFHGAGYNIGAGNLASRYRDTVLVASVCAGGAIYRRSLFEDIGYFDEDFFLIFEDVDVGLRAQAAGYDCVFIPKAVMYHKRGGSTDLTDRKITARAWRNQIWVAVKNLPTTLLIVWAIFFTLRFSLNASIIVLAGVLRRIKRLVGLSADQAHDGTMSRKVLVSLYLENLRQGVMTGYAKRRQTKNLRRINSIKMFLRLSRDSRPIENSPIK